MTWNFVLLFFVLSSSTDDTSRANLWIASYSFPYVTRVQIFFLYKTHRGEFFIVTSKHEKWNKRISVRDGIAIRGSRIMRNYQHFIKVILRIKPNRNQINPNRTRSMQSLIEKATGSSTGMKQFAITVRSRQYTRSYLKIQFTIKLSIIYVIKTDWIRQTPIRTYLEFSMKLAWLL